MDQGSSRAEGLEEALMRRPCNPPSSSSKVDLVAGVLPEASGKDNTGIHFPQKTSGEEFTSQDNLSFLHFMAADLCIFTVQLHGCLTILAHRLA